MTMLTLDECFYVGYVKRALGNDGELEIVLDVDDPSKYRKKESLLLEIRNNVIPFFIEEIRIRQKTAVVILKNINSSAASEPLVGAQVYLPLSELPPLKGKKQFYYHEVKGYKVIDAAKGDIGEIENVLEHTHQAVFQVRFGEKEILIPVTDDFLDRVDKTEKKVYINAPEGLIDLYLE